MESVRRLFALCLLSMVLAPAPPALADDLGAKVMGVMRRVPHDVKGSLLVVDLASGKTVAELLPDRAMMPASNAKLVTAAAAFERLGKDFEFSTEVYLRVKAGYTPTREDPLGGALVDGVFDGDLLLVGSADPCFSGRFYDGNSVAVLERWAGLLKRFGVRRVRGEFLLDASAVTGPAVHPSWPRDQLHRWYCAPVDAFNLNDNCLDITVRAGPRGRLARVGASPKGAFPELRNTCKTVSSGRHRPIVHLGGPGSASISGQFLASRGPWIWQHTMRKPAQRFGTVFRELLRREGIGVAEPRVVREPIGRKGVLFARHRSPISRAVGPVLKNSQNLFAECLFRALGRKSGGRGSFAAGRAAVEAYLGEIKATGVPADGSGLSRDNRYSPRTLVRVLQRMWVHPGRKAFFDALPVAGAAEGSLRKRMRQGAAKGNVFAKTGYIRSASGLSGYVKTRGGRWLAFSMLFNGFAGKLSNTHIKATYQDPICQILAASR